MTISSSNCPTDRATGNTSIDQSGQPLDKCGGGVPTTEIGHPMKEPRDFPGYNRGPCQAYDVNVFFGGQPMIRKLSSGGYRLYSRGKDPSTGRRRNLGTFKRRADAEKQDRAVQFFKRR
jgi:hypothetical protein